MKTRFFALTYSNHDWSVCHLSRKLNDDRVPSRSTLRLKYYLGGLASAFTDKILEGWNERLVSRLCVQNIPSFTAKLMNGSAFPRKKHTEFHVPCQVCIFGHGARNFARDAAFFSRTPGNYQQFLLSPWCIPGHSLLVLLLAWASMF